MFKEMGHAGRDWHWAGLPAPRRLPLFAVAESGGRLPAQERGNFELVILDRRGPGRDASMRIQLALRGPRRRRTLRGAAVFRVERGAAGLGRRGRRDRARRRREVFLAADPESGELFEQRATPRLRGRRRGRDFAAMRSNLILDHHGQILDLRHAGLLPAERLFGRGRDEFFRCGVFIPLGGRFEVESGLWRDWSNLDLARSGLLDEGRGGYGRLRFARGD